MLKRYKNGFIELIKDNDLAPPHFSRQEKEIDSYTAFIIQLENSPLFFLARTHNTDFHLFDCRFVEFAPNYPKSDYYPTGSWSTI